MARKGHLKHLERSILLPHQHIWNQPVLGDSEGSSLRGELRGTGIACCLFPRGWRPTTRPRVESLERESLTRPCPSSLAAPYNHLFSYFHQQPNYWSFKVSARCFCLCDDCMSCPPHPHPRLAHASHWGVRLHGPPPLRARWAWGCRLWLLLGGGAGREWVCLPGACGSRVGILPLHCGLGLETGTQVPSAPSLLRVFLNEKGSGYFSA